MNRRKSPRFGLTIETGVTGPSDRKKPTPEGSATKSPLSSSDHNDSVEIRNAIEIINQFEQSQSPHSRATSTLPKTNRQKRDDSSNKVGSGSNSRVNSGPWKEGDINSTYTPKFFNLEPSSPSPRRAPTSKVSYSDGQASGVSSSTKVVITSAFSPSSKSTTLSPTHKSDSTPRSNKSSPKKSKLNAHINESQPNARPISQAITSESTSPSHSNNDVILPSASSASFNTTSRLQKLMRTPDELILRTRKKQEKVDIPLNVVCNEDGGFEVQEFVTEDTVEEGRIYRMKSNVKWGLERVNSNDAVAKKEYPSKSNSTVEINEIGKNGWHRLNTAWSPVEEKKPSSFSPEAAATLDQLSIIHILQHSLTAYDEYNALHEEHSSLMRELKALEMDRTCLEKMFNEVEKEIEEASPHNHCKSKNKHVANWEYKDFKENITRIDRADRKYLPLMWLEELVVTEEALLSDVVGTESRNENWKKKRYVHSKDMVDKLRDEKGSDLALLLSDVNAKNTLIGRCYMNSIGKGKYNRVLSVEGPAILIPGGGGRVHHFNITGNRTLETEASNDVAVGTINGADKDSGTAYFIKFDAGKSYNRGNLPANLKDRLMREDRDSRSLRYLSTGSPSNVGDGATSYYAEFDDGECWWGTASSLSHEDNALHQLLLEMDVHRIAFGIDSWIIIGKDGEVVWKNIPQGLHDILTLRESNSAAAPCEVSLGMDGSYFVRFVDGVIEFLLPSFVADVCERLEAKGNLIRCVPLHVDTYDCLIRYSKKQTV